MVNLDDCTNFTQTLSDMTNLLDWLFLWGHVASTEKTRVAQLFIRSYIITDIKTDTVKQLFNSNVSLSLLWWTNRFGSVQNSKSLKSACQYGKLTYSQGGHSDLIFFPIEVCDNIVNCSPDTLL